LNVLWKHSFSESRTRPLRVQCGLGAEHPKFGEVKAVGSLRACVAFMCMGDGRARCRANVQSRFVLGTALFGVVLRSRCIRRVVLIQGRVAKHTISSG